MDFNFIILDFETTGLDTKTCMPVEIGAVAVNYKTKFLEPPNFYGQEIWNIVGHFSALNNPGVPIPEVCTNIHGISDDMVGHLEVGGGILDFYEWSNKVIPNQQFRFVCHNKAYDIPIYDRVCGSYITTDALCTMIHPDKTPVLDIGKVNKYGHPAWPKLVDAAEFIGYRFHGAHSALSDAMACLALFKHEVENGLLKID